MHRRRKDKEEESRRAVASGSAQVFSYYAHRSRPQERTERHSKPLSEKSTKERRWPGLLAAIVIALSLLYALWLDVRPRIRILSEGSAATILQDEAVYTRAAEEILKSSLLSHTKVTIDTDKIAQRIKQRFPELANVTITVPLVSHRLLIDIEPVQPVLLFSSTTNGSFVVDESGRAVVPASAAKDVGRLQMPLLYDESSLDVNVGQAVLTREEVSFIRSVLFQLEAAKLKPERLILPLVASELHLRLPKVPYYVKFNMQGEGRRQVGTLLAAQAHLKRSAVIPVRYIDVRVPEKVFYR